MIDEAWSRIGEVHDIKNKDVQVELISQMIDENSETFRNRMRTRFLESGASLTNLSKYTGLNISLFHRAFNGAEQKGGGLLLGAAAMVKLCYHFYHMSVNELIFGDPGVTVLPKAASVIARIISKSNTKQQQAYLSFIQDLSNDRTTEDVLARDYSTSKIMKARILEAAGDDFTSHLTWGAVSRRYGGMIERYISGDDKFSGRIKPIVFIAALHNTTVDYFIAPEYVTYTPIAFHDNPSELVTDETVKECIRQYLLLGVVDKQVKFEHEDGTAKTEEEIEAEKEGLEGAATEKQKKVFTHIVNASWS